MDMIVMETKGATDVKEFFVGSSTEKIVRRAPVPVITIKNSVKASPIKNIVFPSMLHEEEVDRCRSDSIAKDVINHFEYPIRI